MKKKMLMFIIICLFPLVVNAGTVNLGYNNDFYNQCVQSGDCMLLCAYNNRKETSSEENYAYYSSYIYYDFSKKDFFVEWPYKSYHEDKTAYAKMQRNELPSKYVFVDDTELSNLETNGKCPKGAYLDFSGASSELCVGSYEYCLEKAKWNAGTDFEGISIKEYDFQDSIDIYFDNYAAEMINKISCDNYISDDYDFSAVYNNIEKDFENALHGNQMPDFYKNSFAFTNGIKKTENYWNGLKNTCSTYFKEEYNDGNITKEEYEEKQNKLNSRTDEALGELKEVIENLEHLTEVNQDELKSCQSLLGDPSDKPGENSDGSPAYYLSVAFKVLRYVAIILLIILSIIDYVAAVAAQDDDAIKKATSKTIKRAILCVIIFVLPTLIEFVLQFIHTKTIDTCGISGK